MKKINKKLLLLFAALGVALFGLGATACSKVPWWLLEPENPFIPVNPDPTPGPDPGPTPVDPDERPEYGSYYFKAEGEEYTLELSKEYQLKLTMGATVVTATYEIDEQGNITATEIDPVGSTLTASRNPDGSFITVTYNRVSVMRFLKDVTYTVSYNCKGGSEVQSENVRNGEFATQPEEPTYDGHLFLGWYKDDNKFNIPFNFNADAVYGDITLYAYWAEYTPGATEYNISFDLNYEGAPQLDDIKTIGGLLYGNIPEPTREGYTFAGWWYSMYDEADRPTALYKDFTSTTRFTSNTTLYAMWNSEEDPAVWVSVDPLTGVAKFSNIGIGQTGTLKIYGPKGANNNYEYVNVTIGSEHFYGNFDLEELPGGEYRYEFTYGGKTVMSYFAYKMLARVGGFTVDKARLKLVWDPIEGAETYYITVDCGNKAHNHTEYDTKGSAFYDFRSCDMQDGGIKFKVKASGTGYASSTSKVFTYAPVLAAVADWDYDPVTGVLSWGDVEDATAYVVKVNDGIETTVKSAAFDLKPYTGSLKVDVYATAYGFFSPDPERYTYDKTELASPTNVNINGHVLSWTAVNNAVSYEVTVGDKTFSTTGTETHMALDELDISWDSATTYDIAVRAKGAAPDSLWSAPLDASYYALASTLSYENGVVSWSPVIGATGYVVTVNDGDGIVVAAGETSAGVKLTKAGENKITVRFAGNPTPAATDEAELTVTAYTVSFVANAGTSVAPLYLAEGDEIKFEQITERMGFRFSGWYDAAGGAKGNAKLYKDGFTVGGADITLNAEWVSCKYVITYDYDIPGVPEGTLEVDYRQQFTLPVPQNIPGGKIFGGWYIDDFKYTDEFGVCCQDSGWNQADGTVKARYYDALEYTLDTYLDGYKVSAKSDISKIKNLVIPATYNGKKIVTIADNAFGNRTTLQKVYIPDTVTTIERLAFTGCSNIARFEVYDSGEALADEVVFESLETGELVYKNPISHETELWMVPHTVAGEYSIPDGVESLIGGGLDGLSISKVIIPTSVKSIHVGALDLNSLRTVEFLTETDSSKEVALEIDKNAFGKNIISLQLPARFVSAKHEGQEVELIELLSDITALKTVEIVGTYANAAYKSGNGMLYNAAGDTLLYCPSDRDGAITIDSNILAVGPKAFMGTKITAVTFHGGMTSIGERAFYNLKQLTDITFLPAEGSTRLVIGASAFELTGTPSSTDPVNNITFTTEDSAGNILSCGISEIGDRAFFGRREETLVLPAHLTSIGARAFASNYKLTGVDLSEVDSGLVFDDYAFADNSQLGEVEISANVGFISFASVFYNCPSVFFEIDAGNTSYATDTESPRVVLNAAKTEIAYFPKDLDSYTIPATVTKLSNGVFTDCTNLTSITIGKAVELIGEHAFRGCTSLATVSFEAGGTEELVIGDNAFAGCSVLTTISLPARTVSIGSRAFTKYDSKNIGLTSINLNEGLQSIGSYAFSESLLTAITIPYSVNEIGTNAFYKCLNLQTVAFADAPAGRSGSGEIDFGSYVFSGCTSLNTIGWASEIASHPNVAKLPEGKFKTVSSWMFRDTGLVNVVIPMSVVNIGSDYGVGEYAFYRATSLASVTFAGADTAYDTENLNGISIGNQAFYGCTSLTSIELPARAIPYSTLNSYDVFAMNGNIVTSFTDSSGVPDGNSGLRSVSVNANNAYFASYDGILYNKDFSEVVYCPNYHVAQVNIHSLAETIRANAFIYCTEITTVDFDEDTDNAGAADKFELKNATLNTTLGAAQDAVFYGCKKLSAIHFPTRLTKIGDYALYNSGNANTAYALTEITFAEDCILSEVGDKAFANNTGITEFVFPERVKDIGEAVFSGCSSLVSVTVSKLMSGEAIAGVRVGASSSLSLIIPDGSLAQFEDAVLLDNNFAIVQVNKDYISSNHVKEMLIPSSITGIYAGAFSNVSELETITFEDCDEPFRIGDEAFKGSSIKSITLPVRIEGQGALGVSIFENCANLTTVNFASGYNYPTIPESMFKGSGLASISVPNTVTSIGDYAFYGCKNLTSVEFANGDNGALPTIKTIGEYAFSGCDNSAFSEITFPVSLSTIGAYSFSDTALTTVNAEFCAITVIPEGAFAYKPNVNVSYGLTSSDVDLNDIGKLTSFTFPTVSGGGIKTLGKQAFYRQSLATVTIPSSVTGIGDKAFQYCWNMTTVNAKNSQLTALGDDIFSYCYNLTSITLPDSIESMGMRALGFCEKLTELELPEDLTTLGSGAFMNTGIKKITVSPNITSLGSVFDGCPDLKEVSFSSGSNLAKLGSSLFKGAANLKKVTDIPSSVKEIDDGVFWGCTSLEEVSFAAGSTLEKLGTFGTSANGAFKDCASLTTIRFKAEDPADDKVNEFPSSFKFLGKQTFFGCSSLESLDFSNTAMGDESVFNYERGLKGNTFSYCTSLKKLKFPGGLTLISSGEFRDCENLESITFGDQTEETGKVIIPGGMGCRGGVEGSYTLNVGEIDNYIFWGCKKLTDIQFDESYNDASKSYTFRSGVFHGTGITSFTVPAGFKSFSDGLFEDCTSLQSVTFNNAAALTVFPSKFFKNCTSLTSYNISAYIKTIGSGTFAGSGLTSITIPATVTTVGDHAFEDCVKLETVTFAEREENISLGRAGIFSGCTKLKTLVIPEKCTLSAMGSGDGTFAGSHLESLTVPFIGVSDKTTTPYQKLFGSLFGTNAYEGATAVQQKAGDDGNFYTFYLPTTLKNVTVSSNILTLNYGAFMNCSMIQNLTLNSAAGAMPEKMFDGCTGLKTLTITGGLNSVAANALKGNTSVTTVTLPASVTTIGESAFEGCTSLKTLSVEKVRSIGDKAFSGVKLTTVNASTTATNYSNFKSNNGLYYARQSGPSSSEYDLLLYYGSAATPSFYTSVHTIGAYAFAGNTSITSVTVPAAVKSIGVHAFDGCSNLNAVTFATTSSEFKTIPDYGFAGCKFSTITLPSTVTAIGNHAFDSCVNLNKIVISSTTTFPTIGDGALNGVASQTFNFKGSDVVPEANGLLYTENSGKYTAVFYMGNKNAETSELDFKANTVALGDNLFKDFVGLKSITIPATVTSIGEHVFDGCTNLTAVTIPTSSALATVKTYAFANTGITTITLPAVGTLGAYAFAGCASLASADISKYTGTTVPAGIFKDTPALVEPKLPTGITSIGMSAFESSNVSDSNKFNLTSYSSLQTVGQAAFKNSRLSKVNFGGYVKTINKEAFYGADLSKHTQNMPLIIPKNVETVGESAFANTSVKYVKIADNTDESKTNIGIKAFENNAELLELYLGSGISAISSGTINIGTSASPNNVTASFAFAHNPKLQKITYNIKTLTDPSASLRIFNDSGNDGPGIELIIGTSVTKIPAYLFASGLDDKETARLGSLKFDTNSICATIGDNAFLKNQSLWEILFANSLGHDTDTTIPQNAFSTCNNLMRVYIPSTFTAAQTSKLPSGSSTRIVEVVNASSVNLTSGVVATAKNWSLIKGSTATVNDTNLTVTDRGYVFIYKNNTTWTLMGYTGKDGNKLILPRTAPGKNEDDVDYSDPSTYIPYEVFQYAFASNTAVGSTTMITAMKELDIPYAVTAIGANSFFNLYGVDKFTYDANITTNSYKSSEVSRFANMGRNTDGVAVHIGENTTMIPDYTFNGYYQQGQYGTFNTPKFTSLDFGENSKVTYIGKNSFYQIISGSNQQAYLAGELVIPDSVTTIGASAFNYARITKITLGSGLSDIGSKAFSDCTLLKTVVSYAPLNIEAGSTGNGGVAKYATTVENSGLVTVDNFNWFVKGNDVRLVSYAGTGNELTLPKGFTYSEGEKTYNNAPYTVNPGAFMDNTTLTKVSIPDGPTSIGAAAFAGCTSLQTVEFTGGNNIILGAGTAIANTAGLTTRGVFHNCPSLRTVSLPSGITEIPAYMFYGCTLLNEIVVPDSCTSIGGYAFNGCTLLSKITLGSGIDASSKIGTSAFTNCYHLVEIYHKSTALTVSAGATANGNLAKYALQAYSNPADSKFFTKETYYKFYVDSGATPMLCAFTGSGNAILPTDYNGGTYEIREMAFFSNTALTGVTIPAKVSKIGKAAFARCTNLTSVTFDVRTDELTFVDGTADSDCNQGVFHGCTNLETLNNLPNATTKIADFMFYNCQKLGNITTWPSSLTQIGIASFYNCKEFTEITVPKTVTSINKGAFSGCTGITKVTLETTDRTANITFVNGTKTSTGKDAGVFAGCTALETLIGFDSDYVTQLGDYMFYGCSKLTAFTVGKKVTYIGKAAFQNCSGLTSVEFKETSGWKVCDTATATTGTGVTVSNTTTNASYLTKTTTGNYALKWWKRG